MLKELNLLTPTEYVTVKLQMGLSSCPSRRKKQSSKGHLAAHPTLKPPLKK